MRLTHWSGVSHHESCSLLNFSKSLVWNTPTEAIELFSFHGYPWVNGKRKKRTLFFFNWLLTVRKLVNMRKRAVKAATGRRHSSVTGLQAASYDVFLTASVWVPSGSGIDSWYVGLIKHTGFDVYNETHMTRVVTCRNHWGMVSRQGLY